LGQETSGKGGGKKVEDGEPVIEVVEDQDDVVQDCADHVVDGLDDSSNQSSDGVEKARDDGESQRLVEGGGGDWTARRGTETGLPNHKISCNAGVNLNQSQEIDVQLSGGGQVSCFVETKDAVQDGVRNVNVSQRVDDDGGWHDKHFGVKVDVEGDESEDVGRGVSVNTDESGNGGSSGESRSGVVEDCALVSLVDNPQAVVGFVEEDVDWCVEADTQTKVDRHSEVEEVVLTENNLSVDEDSNSDLESNEEVDEVELQNAVGTLASHPKVLVAVDVECDWVDDALACAQHHVRGEVHLAENKVGGDVDKGSDSQVDRGLNGCGQVDHDSVVDAVSDVDVSGDRVHCDVGRNPDLNAGAATDVEVEGNLTKHTNSNRGVGEAFSDVVWDETFTGVKLAQEHNRAQKAQEKEIE